MAYGGNPVTLDDVEALMDWLRATCWPNAILEPIPL